MSKLTEFLDNASRHYYNGSPIISDAQFDALADSCGYGKVGAAVTGKTGKHLFPLLSLQKHYEGESTKPLEGYKNKVCSVKLDGGAVSHLYLDGVYSRSLTRGDGTEGQDVTRHFEATNLIPKKLPSSWSAFSVVQIDGELVAPKTIENSRNYATGALNLKSVDEFKTRAVTFVAYNVRTAEDKGLGAWYDVDMRTLETAGFTTCLSKELDKIYPSDGLVFRINDYATYYELGFTSKHPRAAYALKERAEAVETSLLDVEWQVGKTGKVTPVAILEPVYIGDALVSRATLNNPGFIEMLGLCIGDRVAVIRSGEVIPCITHKVSA